MELAGYESTHRTKQMETFKFAIFCEDMLKLKLALPLMHHLPVEEFFKQFVLFRRPRQSEQRPTKKGSEEAQVQPGSLSSAR